MQRSKNDVWVGLFVAIGAAALLFLALKSANLLSLSFDSTYMVNARFDNIGGLKPKAAGLTPLPSMTKAFKPASIWPWKRVTSSPKTAHSKS